MQIRQTDVAGNVSDAVNLGAVTVDATIAAPSLALTADTNVADDGITSNGEVTVSGLETDATWEVSLDGGTSWDAGTGTTFTLDEGSYADGVVQIRQTDVAGNVSNAVNLGAVTVDTTDPTGSIAFVDGGDGLLNLADISAVDLTGSIEAGLDSSNVVITITDSAEPANEVTVATTDITIDGAGNLSVTGLDLSTETSGLTEGVLTVSMTVTDVAGNTFETDGTTTSDLTTPEVPSLALTTDTNVADDGITSNGEVTVSGLETDATWEVSLDGGTTWLAGTGTTFTLDEGSYADGVVQIRQTDLAGNVSDAVNLGAVTVDTTDPTGSIAFVDGGDGLLNLADISAVDLTGSIEAGLDSSNVVITITDSADPANEITVATTDITIDGAGNLSVTGLDLSTATSGLTEGVLTISMTVTDVAGNTFETDDTTTSDLTAPEVPSLALTADTNVADDGITSNGEVTVSGLETDATWEVSLDGGTTWDARTGTTFTLDEGVYADGVVQIRQTDLAGNVSDAVNLGAVTVDTTDPTGSIAFVDGGDGLLNLANINAVDLTGSIEAGLDSSNVVITITDSAEPANEYTVDAGNISVGTDGALSVTGLDLSALTAGALTVSMTVTDVAGNTFETDGTTTSDLTAPEVPSLALTADTNVADDGITSNGEVTVSDLEADASWEYTTDGGTTWVDGTGATFTLAAGSYADGTVQIRQTDVAGNVSDAVNLGAVTVDTTDPTGSIAFVDGDDGLLNLADISAVDLTGSIEAGLDSSNVVITITDSTEPANEYTVDAGNISVGTDGALSVTGLDLSALTAGALTVSMTVTDVAGNTFETDDTTTSDLTVPEVPSLALTADTNVADDGITSNGEVTVSGLETDATWEVSLDGGTTWDARTGTTFTLDEGVYADGVVQIRQTDLAGNVSDAVNLGAVTVDTTDPTGSIAFVDGADGFLNVDDITAVALSGSIEAGLDSSNVVITITNSAEPANEYTVDAGNISVGTDGALSVTGLNLSALTAGALTVSMTVTDVAGNTAEATGATTSDLTAPLDSAIDFVDGDDGQLNASDITAVALSGSIEAGLDSSNVVITITDSADPANEYTVDAGNISVGTDGALSVTGLDLSALTAGSLTVSMTVTDAAGNTDEASGATTSDLTAPLNSAIDFVDGDDGQLNASDITDVALSGSIEAGLDNGNVVITITDSADPANTFTVDSSNITVDDEGNISVTGLDLSALTAGALSVAMTVTDAAGNTATATGATESDLTAPDAIDNTIYVVNAVDGEISAAASTDLLLAGTVEEGLDVENINIVITDSEDNSITVSDDDIVIDGTGLTVDGQDISGLADGDIDVKVTVTDDAGNSTDISAEITKLASDFLNFDENTRLMVSETGIAAATMEASDSLAFADTSSTAVLSLSSSTVLTSNGDELTWVASEDGQTLEAQTSEGTAVFQVTVVEDGSDITYSAVLLGNIDQDEVDSTTVDILVTLTDGGATTSGTLEIVIEDDTPKLATTAEVVALSLGTDYTGNIFDGDESLGYGFGADSSNGQVQSFTLQGLTFTLSDDGTYADITGTSDVFDLSAGDTITVADGILAVETNFGESFSIDISTGDYTYSHDGKFRAADEANTRPQANVTDSDGVLGIVGINVLDIVTLSEDQLYSVYDAENNVTSVTLSTSGLLSSLTAVVDELLLGTISTQNAIDSLLGTSSWTYSEVLASELGLTVTPDTDTDSEKIITISDSDGGEVTNLELNELLASIEFTISVPGLLSLLLDLTSLDSVTDSILSNTTIYATDALAATSSDTDASLANVGLLVDDYVIPVDEGTTGNDTGSDSVTATEPGSNLYGYAGDDTLIGGSGSNILRGGSGDDTLDGAAGSDLLIGGSGDDSLDGGTGVDVIRWEAGDEGTVTTPATDTVLDFNNDSEADAPAGDTLDLTDLLDGAYYVGSTSNNLANYITFEYVAAGVDTAAYTAIYISTTGDLNLATDGYNANQIIKLEGVDITSSETLSDSDIIDALITDDQLLIGTEVNETNVSVTIVDGDGDTATGDITFIGNESLDSVSNVAPTVTADDDELLGLVGLEALGLIDLYDSNIFVADSDNNLQTVVLDYSALVTIDPDSLITAPAFTWNNDLANALGLIVQDTGDEFEGIIGTVAANAQITITAADGGDIDNGALNQLLATVTLDQGGINLVDVELFDALSITATDVYDAETTGTLSSLVDVDLLDSSSVFSGIDASSILIGDVEADVFDESSSDTSVYLYGFAGNDVLTGGSASDALQGGDGDDTLIGNLGDDYLSGGAGSNIFDGGEGDDTLVTSTLTFEVDGGAGIDTLSFDNTGESIDLTALLDSNVSANTATNVEVLDISASSETGTSLKIDADTVLNLTDDDNELYIDGDEGDSVEADGATTTGATAEFNGTTYDTYQLGDATLYIDQDVTVNTNNG
ncbi:hypothetical protein [Cobetia sp. 5-11-6-3]|uniref:hypothetical protein n=1 Tax=Cobetia sp. 5-11-6-3 TaxID=2737458 RepID=UPI001C3F32C7|nr:hypothetical protein [Cobetia sp. 5-11-6-3]